MLILCGCDKVTEHAKTRFWAKPRLLSGIRSNPLQPWTGQAEPYVALTGTACTLQQAGRGSGVLAVHLLPEPVWRETAAGGWCSALCCRELDTCVKRMQLADVASQCSIFGKSPPVRREVQKHSVVQSGSCFVLSYCISWTSSRCQMLSQCLMCIEGLGPLHLIFFKWS